VYTILMVTEEALGGHDVSRVAQLHGDEPVTVHLLVPADTKHNALIEALDEAALGRLRDAFDDSDDASPAQAEQDAMHAVNASIGALREAGIEARGSVTGNDPVPAAIEAAKTFDVDEVIVVTPPHLVEEMLHRDWASRLRDKVKVPLLHFVAGTDRVVS
jgi:hypothetical protein